MPVVIRETRVLGGEETPNIKVYKSERPVTKDGIAQAERLDEELSLKMRQIRKDLQDRGLLSLKGKSGVVKLWHELGRQLHFLDSISLSPAEDRRFLWRALYDHAGELAPGEPSVRAESRPETSHFHYCYLLGDFTWEFVEAAGDWTSWSEFFDSEKIREDRRIIAWLIERSRNPSSQVWKKYMTKNRQGWFRKLAKEIRGRFRNIDTSVFDESELYGELDAVFAHAIDGK